MKTFLAAALLFAGAAAAASPDDNAALARRVFDQILSRGRFELAATLYAPSFVNHGRKRDVGLAVDQAAARGWRDAAPDVLLAPELTVAEGDLVAVLWRGTGTNTGTGNGLPATGRRFEGRGITLWRIQKGRIQEEWSEFGMLDFLQQAGLVPGGAQAGAPTDLRSHLYAPAASAVPRAERERNRRVARQTFEEIVGRGKMELFDRIYAPGYLNHGSHADGTLQGEIEGVRALRTLAPDLAVQVLRTVAQGDLVTVLWSAQGAHTGTALGLAATGKTFHLRGMSILRLANGRISEEWSVLDRYSVLIELGILPAPAGPA